MVIYAMVIVENERLGMKKWRVAMSEELKVIINKLEQLENRFDTMENRFDTMENRFDAMETRFDAMETRFDAMETRFDAMENRLGEMETQFDEKLDARFHESENLILEYVDDRTKYLENKIDSVQKELNQLNGKYDVLLHEQSSLRLGLELAIKNSDRIAGLEKEVAGRKNIRVLQ